MANKIFKNKKVLTIILIIIILFLVIFLPVYFLVIKNQSSSAEINVPIQMPPHPSEPQGEPGPFPCSYGLVTFSNQSDNLIKDNMITVIIPTSRPEYLQSLFSLTDMKSIYDIINNTNISKPCYVSWFNTQDNFNTNHEANYKQHYIENIKFETNKDNTKLIIKFKETTLNGINPFPLHIHNYYNCINIESCKHLKTIYPPE